MLQLVWVCLPGSYYGVPLHVILLLRLFRMKRVFLLVKVPLPHMPTYCCCEMLTAVQIPGLKWAVESVHMVSPGHGCKVHVRGGSHLRSLLGAAVQTLHVAVCDDNFAVFSFVDEPGLQNLQF